MKKINLFKLSLLIVISFFTLFVIASCNKNGTTDTPEDPGSGTSDPSGSGTQEKKPDVNLPTELELNGEVSVAIHYHRDDMKYAKWRLWLWDPTGTDDNEEDTFNYMDDFGVIAYYPLAKFGDFVGGKLGIIIKTAGSWTKDGTENDRFIEWSKFTMDENKIYHVYFFGGDGDIYSSKDKTKADSIETAAFTSEKNIKVACSNTILKYAIYKNDTLLDEVDNVNRLSFNYELKEAIDLQSSYKVVITFAKSQAVLERFVDLTNLYSTELFENAFNYSGELGAIYTAASTTFKVWSPVSSKILLRLYENGTPTSVSTTFGSDVILQEVEMTKGEKGVFSTTISGDLHGKYYTYVVYNGKNNGVEIVDPYAHAAGVNGLRGLIVDFDRIDPEGWNSVDYLDIDRLSMVVYETHVADVTSSATWGGSTKNQRKYLGLIETGTVYQAGPTTVKTGFDHIEELGVNAVQLLPIFDQANDETKYEFNWGYNPLNYNVVEGLYSSDPYDGLVRISELKQVIKAFNEAGISTIMDVVYNHVNGANGSNFDVLMPNYYFRYNSDGSLSNGSGCGNEVASERSMVRKFIVDSTKFWIDEFKLGGFRFDLMGLIDLTTMDEVASECTKINSHAVIYGEPWQGGSSPLSSNAAATQANGNKYQGYGQFNDQMRDALIKGGMNDKTSKGWITNTDFVFGSDVQVIQTGINGGTYKSNNSILDPKKNVTYVTCHDNYTLYDRIKAAGITAEETIRKMALLANSIVLTSCGTSFILAGEEFLRTKQGDNNSYKSPDSVNQLNYGLLVKNNDIYEAYRTLINFKKTCVELHSANPNINVEVLNSNSILKYTLHSGDDEYLVIHANGLNHSFSMDLSNYSVVLDTLNQVTTPTSSTSIQSFQTLILKKN